MITSAIRSLEEKVAAKKSDEDPFPNGTVIRWKRRFSKGGRTYTYAALRAGGKWYLTGTNGNINGMSYGALISLLSGDGVKKIAVAAEWSRIGPSRAPRAAMATSKRVCSIPGCGCSGYEHP